MQVSFRLLAQAKLIAISKTMLDEEYITAQKEATQQHVADLNRLRKEYMPMYSALRREMDLLWEEIKEETGIEDEQHYAVLEDGSLVRTSGLCGGLRDL